MNTKRVDKYESFAALARAEPPVSGAWRIDLRRRNSSVLIIAPHGGGIEPGTSELAKAIAGDTYNIYLFEGLKRRNNGDLHITSHRFDAPCAREFVAECSIVLGVHGCNGSRSIFVGGLDAPLVARLTRALQAAGFPASHGPKFMAVDAGNICNRGKRLRGAQLEVTRDIRSKNYRQIALIVRNAIRQYQNASSKLWQAR
jgi:phage replication-related protein YjqB (UPF0714/DUF867 family)